MTPTTNLIQKSFGEYHLTSNADNIPEVLSILYAMEGDGIHLFSSV